MVVIIPKMSKLVQKLIAFAKTHEPDGGYFGYGTLVDLLQADPGALNEFAAFFDTATAEQLDTLDDDDEYGWVIGGAADELDLLPDDPRNFKSETELKKIPADKLLGELCSACILNDTNAVRTIAEKLNVNQLDHNNQTPLCYAVGNNNLECVDILLANGADPNVVQNWGNTAMHICASTVSSKEIWKRLVEHGGKPENTNDRGETAVEQLHALKRSAWMA